MSEYKFQLSGWQAIVAVVVLIGIFGIRLMTFNDKKDDKALMKKIELELLMDYFPDDVEDLKTAYESGDMDELDEVAKSVTSTRLNVASVQTSYPLFDLSSPKIVIVKVTYSLIDDSGEREKKINYFRFKHHTLGNRWQYIYESSAVSYYLNFW